jgi:Leucine-rich repeat (LRR) protein
MIGAQSSTYWFQFNSLKGEFPFASVPAYVRKINFEYNDITGSNPSSIERLTNLAGFTMQHNQISGSLPTELGIVSTIYRLRLNHNVFTGTLPTELGFLSNVLELTAHDNLFTGTIPSPLLQTRARQIVLDNNLLNRTTPQDLKENTRLQLLSFTGNDLTGTIPSSIEQFKEMEALYFDFNKLSGAIPESIGNLTNLGALFLDGNDFTGRPLADDSWLWNLRDMEFLDLSSNRFSGTSTMPESSIFPTMIFLDRYLPTFDG